MVFGFLKKKKKKSDNRYFTLTVKDVIAVSEDAVNVVFENPGSRFVYEPGQFITVIDVVDGEKLRRAYSLCTTPFLDEYPAITVKRVQDGRMSNHINNKFKAGDKVEVMEPMGHFTTKYDNDKVRKAIFFGGGSGITPLYSIMRSVLEKESFSKVALVYGNRNEKQIIFRKELEALSEEFGGRFQLIHILEEDPEGLTHHHGLPTTDLIGDILTEINFGAAAEFYICGPQPMMDVVKDGLIRADVDTDKIKMESFASGVTSPEDRLDGDSTAVEKGVASRVTILLEGEEYEVDVAPDIPVLDAALDQNIDMPYSCQSGLCTACRAKCLEGKVSKDAIEGLTEEEVAQGYVLLCVGKALTDKVKVEVG
ncbi:ferredoxin--NADP reductase [Marinoscillum sp. MHG1-6]|uniref:ferredoxin--NADP reductase n=1 Tax=Marinoscillum sp. MHG1-6 TaxID=2959627 RepID=UPI002158613B|nr:ferredoxin--NADP reductase [Marinoscillum sp. MHG1-6]